MSSTTRATAASSTGSMPRRGIASTCPRSSGWRRTPSPARCGRSIDHLTVEGGERGDMGEEFRAAARAAGRVCRADIRVDAHASGRRHGAKLAARRWVARLLATSMERHRLRRNAGGRSAACRLRRDPETSPLATPYKEYVTQWGNDPIWESPFVAGVAPTRDRFPACATAAGSLRRMGAGSRRPPKRDQPPGPFEVRPSPPGTTPPADRSRTARRLLR